VPEDSFSDHRKISFALQQDRRPSIKRQNVRKTDWDTSQSELDAHIGLWLGSVHTPADIEQELDKVNSAIIQSYETACPARKCSGRKKVPCWNHELSCLRKKLIELFILPIGRDLNRIGINTCGKKKISKRFCAVTNGRNGAIFVLVQKASMSLHDSTKS